LEVNVKKPVAEGVCIDPIKHGFPRCAILGVMPEHDFANSQDHRNCRNGIYRCQK
jgi:hypothetical protein